MFYNVNVQKSTVLKELQVDYNTRSSWLAREKLSKHVDHRSYATVVLHGKAVVQTAHVPLIKKHVLTKNKPYTLDTTKKVSKIIPSPQGSSKPVERRLWPSNSHTQQFSIPLTNRFTALQEAVHTQSDQHEATSTSHTATVNHCISRGNKNGKWAKLGIAGQQQKQEHTTVVDQSFDSSFKGNKNKNGKKLGVFTDEKVHSCSDKGPSHRQISQCPLHADFTFRGNKNGTGSKLGRMRVQTCDYSDNIATADSNNSDKQSHTADNIQFLGNKNGNGTKLGTMSVVATDITSVNNAPHDSQILHLTDCNSDNSIHNNTRIRRIPPHIYGARYQSVDYKNCIYQNDKNFGFCPLNDLMVYTGHDVTWGNIPNILQAHATVRQSGLPNFMGCRIPVETQLKVPAWKKYLQSYWDNQLVDLIQFGFPLDFNRDIDLQSTDVNHTSALTYPDHVSKYIREEIQYGAIWGPFKDLPFHCHVSPFLTREKPNSSNRRVILDLSFPPGHSVNDGVDKDKYLGSYFELKYPSVDDIVHSLRQLGPNALLYKIDISRAFRHIRIDPGDLDLLGLKHGDYFIDGTLPFGFRHGSVFFQRCTDAVRYVMKEKFHYPNLYNYIDDLIYTGLPGDIYQSYHTLIQLLHELGLDISISKLIEPTTVAICLGIEIDTVNRTLKIPIDKLKEIQLICQEYVSKHKVTKRQYQSLLGSLLYITKCVKPARFFLNRMLMLLRENVHTHFIKLDTEFHRDLQWFNTFLLQYNGITFYDNAPTQATVFLDASLQGLGGVFQDMVYTLPLPRGFRSYSIVHLEILNIVVALKLWAPLWKDQTIDIRCDNMAVVEVLNTGRAKDAILATCARNIWLLASIYNVHMVINHIPGVSNVIADLLSRWQGTALNMQTLSNLVPSFQWVPVHIDHTKLNEDI